jgi:DNA-directed RNA polymerase specialized sigma24 family protein
MSTPASTCRTVIHAMAAGSPTDREELARRYLGTVRAYLAARWGGSALRDDHDDATQEVFSALVSRSRVLTGRAVSSRANPGRT